MIPRTIKQSQEEFIIEGVEVHQRFELSPLTSGDILRAWRDLRKGDEVIAIHAHSRFESTLLQVKTAARLMRPANRFAIFEALSHHSVRQIIDILVQYRHELTLDLAAFIVHQIKMETASWVLQPQGARSGGRWRQWFTRFRPLEWYAYEPQTSAFHNVPRSDILSDIYRQTSSSHRVNVYVTGYPSVAPASNVLEDVRSWSYVQFMEITQLQVWYPHLPTLVIIEFLPSKDRIETIVRNALSANPH